MNIQTCACCSKDCHAEAASLRAEVDRLSEALRKCLDLSKRRALGQHECPHSAWLVQIEDVTKDYGVTVIRGGQEIACLRAEVKRLTEELEIERRRADAATNREQAWEDEVERLRAENINLFDTVLAAMCAAVGKPVITIKESTKDQIPDLQKEVCSLGEKLSAIIARLRSDARLGAMVRKMPAGVDIRRHFHEWDVIDRRQETTYHSREQTPEEALEKAGCEEA